MEALELVLLLAAAVLASSVVSQFLPKVPTSLVQVCMGLAIAFLASGQVVIELDPELFLVLFIAPLLYDEARNANLGDLWRHKKPILVYAVGLVLAIVLIVGFALHWAMPSIPLAAAFALGAALGPTDAVAVASVSKQTNISTRNHAILKGEALLNDASGLVSFQFAVAAVVTGGFSLYDAGLEFLVMFFGGVALGLVCGFLINLAVDKVRDLGLQDTTFHVLLEVFIPFIVYLLAEHIGVSGIIAVVVTGVVNVITPRTSGAALSRTSIVSNSVWQVLAFALNGVVFVMLGTQLPSAMMSTWENYAIANEWLILMVLVITLALELVRFIFSLGVEFASAWRSDQDFHFGKENLLSALALTLSGAKGTITLSIMFTLPFAFFGESGEAVAFPYRDLLIFLACGVILTTLLLATFVVPLIAPKKQVKESEQQRHDRDVETLMDILRTVIEELTDRQTRDTAAATASVVSAYNDRIQRIKDDNDIDQERNVALRLRCVGWEKEFIVEQMNLEAVDQDAAYERLSRLARREELLRHDSAVVQLWSRVVTWASNLKRRAAKAAHRLPFLEPSEHSLAVRELQMKEYEHVIRRLTDDMSDMDDPSEDVAAVILDYQRRHRQLQMTMPSFTALTNAQDKGDEIELLALRLELRFVNEAAEEGRLSRQFAKRQRENVYMMLIDLEDRI